MLKLFSALITLSLISCANRNVDNLNMPMETTMLNDSIVEITIDSAILFHWNNNHGLIENDASFEAIRSNFSNYKIELAKMISNNEPSVAECSEVILKNGDLAYVLIDKIYNLPTLKILGLDQIDVFEYDCKYPPGLFEEIDFQREDVSMKVENILRDKSMD